MGAEMGEEKEGSDGWESRCSKPSDPSQAPPTPSPNNYLDRQQPLVEPHIHHRAHHQAQLPDRPGPEHVGHLTPRASAAVGGGVQEGGDGRSSGGWRRGPAGWPWPSGLGWS